MDSITHLALGAVIGEAIAGKKIGKKAMVLGAATQFFPDIDVVAALWLSPADNLVAHRGLTHSLFFAIIASLLFAVLAYKFFRKIHATYAFWLLFFGTQLVIHIFVDTFNAYGIGLWEPLRSTRYSFDAVYVADPLFSLWLIAGAIFLIALKKNKTSQRTQRKFKI